jgi:DNA-binding response OmpR family regulator
LINGNNRSAPEGAGAVHGLSVRQAGNIWLDRETCRVEIDEQRVGLTHQEFELLAAFLDRPDRVLPRSEICELLWGASGRKESKRLAVVVSHLREKLARAKPYAIECVRSRGYGLIDQQRAHGPRHFAEASAGRP